MIIMFIEEENINHGLAKAMLSCVSFMILMIDQYSLPIIFVTTNLEMEDTSPNFGEWIIGSGSHLLAYFSAHLILFFALIATKVRMI